MAPVEGIDTHAVEESVFAAIKDLKALLGREFLTSWEAEEEKEDVDDE